MGFIKGDTRSLDYSLCRKGKDPGCDDVTSYSWL